MQFCDLVEVSRQVAATRARGRKAELLAAVLTRASGEESELAVALLSGEPRQGRIGLGAASLRTAASVPAAAAPSLSLSEVDAACASIAEIAGRGAAAARAERVRALLVRATREEQDFLVRLFLGELRQGALEGVLTEAVSRAAGVPLSEVQRGAMLRGALPPVARIARERGVAGLREIRLELGRPLQAMLAQSAEDPADAMARLGQAGAEWKLDGARVQAHRDGDEVRLFTRSGNDVTAAAPELVDTLRTLPARAFVMDGEALSLRADGGPQPFQVTMRRFGRRLGVEQLRRELPLSGLYFDLLHLDGEDLLDRPLEERRRLLESCVPPSLCIPRRVVSSARELEVFLGEALRAGHEGIVAKALGSPYEAGRRGAGWLKVKPVHTLDLVVLAAEWGSGRRRGWLSNLHLGARDPRRGGFVMLGKTFKGLTDERLAWQTQRFLALETGREGHIVHVRPEQVVEIAFDAVQRSPHYPGGVALRFARVRRYRDDKTPSEADTIDAVQRLAVGGTAEGV